MTGRDPEIPGTENSNWPLKKRRVCAAILLKTFQSAGLAQHKILSRISAGILWTLTPQQPGGLGPERDLPNILTHITLLNRQGLRCCATLISSRRRSAGKENRWRSTAAPPGSRPAFLIALVGRLLQRSGKSCKSIPDRQWRLH